MHLPEWKLVLELQTATPTSAPNCQPSEDANSQGRSAAAAAAANDAQEDRLRDLAPTSHAHYGHNKNNNNFMSYLGIKEKMQKQINKTNNENFILWCWDSGANKHVVPVSVELDNETMVNQMLKRDLEFILAKMILEM